MRKATNDLVPWLLRWAKYSLKGKMGQWMTEMQLAHLKKKTARQGPGTVNRCFNFTVRINDGPNYYTMYKDIFVKRIYHFNTERSRPYIVDCGSNIGVSILYFKHVYPRARILGFEPDPAIFPYLRQNIVRNRLKDVKVIQAGLAACDELATFYSDAKCGSFVSEHDRPQLLDGWKKHKIPCRRLRDFLCETVDFLKINIEGAEWDVLSDSAGALRNVREAVIEYHHLPGFPRTLHKILELLHEEGFEYLINDFDYETNSSVRPPFVLTHETSYYLLIYAKQIDANIG